MRCRSCGLWRAVGIREKGFLRDMGKGACGVDRVKIVPFEGGRRDGEEKKERKVVVLREYE
jgi:hypothetical protein